MRINCGSDRIAIIFPLLKIVIKLPRIRLIKSFCQLFEYVRQGRWRNIKEDWSWPLEIKAGFKGLLFYGIVENWREFLFYARTRNKFLQPTYFSFFGLLNFQLYGNAAEIDCVELWSRMVKITDGAAWKDNHHFSNPKNFCRAGRKLRIVDYSSPQCQEVIEPWGEKIIEEFDFSEAEVK